MNKGSGRTKTVTPEGPKQKTWKSFPLDNYRVQADQLVTHSTKGVNTNAAGGGIRVIPGNESLMPYACARFGREPIALDYTKNSTQPFPASVVTEQLDAVRTGNYESFTDVVSSECTEIQQSILPLLNQHHDASGSRVSPRLRQILLRDDQRGDVCLTPIHSGGFSARLHHLMQDALDILAESVPNGDQDFSFFDDVVIKIGGDKAQNAGRIRLIGAMQKAYRFAIPQAEQGLNRLIALHHRGVSLSIPQRFLEAYGKYLRGLHERDEKQDYDAMRRTHDRMNRELQHIAGMIKTILRRGDAAHERITPHVGTVLETVASPDLPLVQQGLLNPEMRQSQAWRTVFAAEMAHQIAGAKKRDGETLIVGITERSGESLQKHIMEVLG